MKPLIPLLLAVALAAPVAADTPEKAAAFLGAMRDAGCDMSLAAADDAAEGLGIATPELDEIIDLLFFGSQLRIGAEEHMTLVPALCDAPASEDAALFARLQAEIDLEALGQAWFGTDAMDNSGLRPERGALFIAAIRANGCSLARDEAERVIQQAGIAPGEAHAASAVLFEAGHLDHAAGPDELRLSEALCAADPAGDAALHAEAVALVVGPGEPEVADDVITGRFGPEGVRAVLEFLADSSDCVLDTSDRAGTVDSVMAFMAFNVTGIHNLPADFSPEAEAELRATIDRELDNPGPAFVAEPGRLTLIDCTP